VFIILLAYESSLGITWHYSKEVRFLSHSTDELFMNIFKSCLLLTVLLSFSGFAQDKSMTLEKQMLQKLSQNKELEIDEIKVYLQSISSNQKDQVQNFQQRYQDQLMEKTKPSDDPMTAEMQLKDMEKKLDILKQQFEKADLEYKKDCSVQKKSKISDLGVQVKKISDKVGH
jgi:hypothetical protein